MEELNTHGGSLRIYASCKEYARHQMRASVSTLLNREDHVGLKNIQTYSGFTEQMQKIKLDTLALLTELKRRGKHIAAFGAVTKGIL